MCHMRALTTTNLDYLTARLHGRRSRMAEADRLDALCRLRSVSELARHVWPDSDVQTVADFQRRLAEDLTREISEFLPLLDKPGARSDRVDVGSARREGADGARVVGGVCCQSACRAAPRERAGCSPVSRPAVLHGSRLGPRVLPGIGGPYRGVAERG